MPVLSTLASGSGAVAGKKPGRLLVSVLHGSSTGGVSRSKGTPLPKLIHLIDTDEDTVLLSTAGVGTSGGFLDIFSSALGLRLNRNVVMTYKAIVENYRLETADRECDRILLAGFSRGGDIAIKVARLIEIFGVVCCKDAEDKLYRKLYELCAIEAPWSQEMIGNIKRGYKWIENVMIAEILIFDGVSTLGVPATGIGRTLKLLPSWSKNSDHVTAVPSNVLHASHAIVLHEPREPYENFTLCIPAGSRQVLRQVYFHGRHGDSMNTGPMSWQVQNLKTDLNLKFNSNCLNELFPGPTDAAIPDWVFSDIKPVKSTMLAFLGSKARIPGRHSRPGIVTNEEIHSSVRHRGYGSTDQDRAVEGFHPESDRQTGCNVWVQNSRYYKNNSSGSEEIEAPLRLRETYVGECERLLSGLPAN